MGRVLLCAAAAKQHAIDILDSAYADATSWHARFDLDESKEVLDGRTRQREELPSFFAAIQRGIPVGCALQTSEALKETFTLGAWGGFFDGLRSGRHSAELTKNTMQRGKKIGGSKGAALSDKSASSRSDSDDSATSSRSRRKREKRKKRKSTSATSDGGGRLDGKGRGGSSNDGSARGSGVKYKFRVHYPCSVKIIGPAWACRALRAALADIARRWVIGPGNVLWVGSTPA
jgi:hypothetical protein